MKQLIYLSIVLILNSCVDQGSSDIEYTIFNQTDKSVKVLGYDRDFENPENSEKATSIVIGPNSSFKVIRITGINNDTGFRFYSIQGVDSVHLIFNNQKIKIYTLETSATTQDFSIFRGDENHQHFITEQDYEDAEDCNGNCD